MPNHVALWIDHKEAHIFHIHADAFEGSLVVASPRGSIHHKHPRAAGSDTEHPDDEKRFFAAVAGALAADDSVLLVGPGKAKLSFLRYVQAHTSGLDHRIVGIETVDHPTDKQVVAHARVHFGLEVPRGLPQHRVASTQ